MTFRISAVTRSGGAVSVIVDTALDAISKVEGYEADGFTEIVVTDLKGNLVTLNAPKTSIRLAK